MTTIPARLATFTKTSSGITESRKRALKLYRNWYRAAPEICVLYSLSESPAYVRHAIRQRFENMRNVTDPRAIDVLLLKERQEYQETMNCWKQVDHVTGVLLKPQNRPKQTFLQKFYEGRDEQAVIPGATGIF